MFQIANPRVRPHSPNRSFKNQLIHFHRRKQQKSAPTNKIFTMSNNETFLSVATEENPEPQGAGVFTVPNYIPGSNDAFARSLSVETGGIDQLYPNGSADHTSCVATAAATFAAPFWW
jgi:hypothetical protein